MGAVDARGLVGVGIWAGGLRTEGETVEHSRDRTLSILAHGSGVSAKEVTKEDGDEAEVVVWRSEGQRGKTRRGKGEDEP